MKDDGNRMQVRNTETYANNNKGKGKGKGLTLFRPGPGTEKHHTKLHVCFDSETAVGQSDRGRTRTRIHI